MDEQVYRVLILGDFHYGESYQRAGAPILEKYGYEYSTRHLQPFIEKSDSFILNLETPLAFESKHPSSLRGQKKYIHWADPDSSGNALKTLGVDAVSLANNHTVDLGHSGMESTFNTLAELGIPWFGAGKTLEQAQEPYRLTLPDWLGGGEIHFHGSFQYSSVHDKKFGFYAGKNSLGCAPLEVPDVPEARRTSTHEDSFQVAFPHWGANYVWRDKAQYRLAHRLLRKEYDLILGHGSHAMQEVHRKQQRWVVYGIGNGNFQSGGRWKKYEEKNGILPFSFWSILEIRSWKSRRQLTLKLYPVYSDNWLTDFQPGPISPTDFARMLETLSTRSLRPWRFDNPARTTGEDDLGPFLALDLGEWAQGKRPERLAPALEGSDPGEWPLRSPGIEMEDRVLRLDKHLGAGIFAMGAQADGGTTRWLTRQVALIECRGKRILTQRYRAHESPLGSTIVNDKVLSAELFEESRVATPKTLLVESAEEAVKVAATFSGPVVVKPRNGLKSRGVSTNLMNQEEIRDAYALARKYSSKVLIQQHVEAAEELRVMASPDQAVTVIRRVLPHVIGDGISTIGQLIEDKNFQRSLNPSLTKRSIPVDLLTHRELERQGLSLHDVPGLGSSVTVRNVAGLSVGADAFQALEVTSAWITDTATAAVAAIPGLGWGGVDLIIEKGTNKPYVIEINTEAGYGQALFPTYGQPRDVISEAWKLRYDAATSEPMSPPELPESRFAPLPMVTDSQVDLKDGKVALSRLFEDSLTSQGYTIKHRNNRVLEVSSSERGSIWITRDGLTSADRSVVRHVMRRHEWVSRLLRLRNVPRTRSRSVNSAHQLTSFVEGRDVEVILNPASAPWIGPDSNVVTEQEALSIAFPRQRMWVQSRPKGSRLRVLATKEKSWLITAKVPVKLLSRGEVIAAGNLAVQAIRAIPELRWAAVDVLIHPKRIKEGRLNGALVEGITLVPEYVEDDQIIAGNFEDFSREIAGFSESETM